MMKEKDHHFSHDFLKDGYGKTVRQNLAIYFGGKGDQSNVPSPTGSPGLCH